ncbi:beta-N-acetylhexosaminidase [Lacibacterium aquatile]|uniref:Beta-N-acetylhexosaminidase n=1 Tax=Lacibacterium aquatile TaxID=1168082 RepID=A0ABW5DPW2_9PROT
MSDFSRAGRHFLIGLQPSPDLTDHDAKLLARLKPAGVVLFKGNFDHEAPYEAWVARLSKLLADVRRVIGRPDIVVSIDHESGRVQRTPAPITRFAAARHWGSAAGTVGAAHGRELTSLGFNLSFAPVCDIDSNPDNPVIGDRSFGRDPQEVADAATAYWQGLESAGVRGCAKHFPGHGDTSVDSHLSLPTLNLTLDELEARELIPFRQIVKAGVPMVMTAHILFPRIQPGIPATLAPMILRGLLRQGLDFKGLICTDDLGMKAISSWFGEPDGAVAALSAGCDLLCLCAAQADTGTAIAQAEAILQAEARGLINLTNSQARIADFIGSLRQPEPVCLSAEQLAANAAVAPLK